MSSSGQLAGIVVAIKTATTRRDETTAMITRATKCPRQTAFDDCGAGGARTHDRRIMSPFRSQSASWRLTWPDAVCGDLAPPHFGTYLA
jgi:hypothetical protein